MRVLLSDGSGLTARQTESQLADAGHRVDVLSPDPLCLARFTRREPQLRSMVRLESVLVSAFGTVGGLLLGGFLGWALAEAGARSSGLTAVSFPAAPLLVIAILGGAAGVIAAIRPARRAARLPVLRAIAAE